MTVASGPRRSALVIVDVQNDFCTGGTLPVPDADGVVPALNRHIEKARAAGIPVFASRDWHPPVTTHFAPYGGPWPVHCVAGTTGARFHPDLRLPPDAVVVSKGQHPEHAGYSAFDGQSGDGVPLGDALRARGITHLFVGGLATDYCVKASVLDALDAGLDVTVLADAIAGVEQHPGDVQRALREMRERGALFETQ